jgi:hypothetical protein
MFALKSPRRFAFPARGSREFTPAIAAGALILLLALQAAMPSRTDLPADSGLAPRHARPVVAPAIPTYPALARRDVFSPNGGGAVAGQGDAAAAPLDQRQVVGVLITGHRASALIKAPGAMARLFTVGQTIDGWRLADIRSDAVVFQRGAAQRRLVVGAPAQSTADQPPSAPPGAETSP